MDFLDINSCFGTIYTVFISLYVDYQIKSQPQNFTSVEYPNDTAVFIPDQPLDFSMGYEVEVEGAVYGNADSGDNFDITFFTQGAVTDSSSPNVVSTYPVDGQTGWDWNRIFIIMDKPLAPSTLNSSTLALSGPGDTSYSVVYYSEGVQILAVRPNSTLEANQSYTVTMTTGLTDAEGHPLSQDYSWTFNTGALDTTPPFVVQTQPANDSISIKTYDEVFVYFSENIDPSTINTRTITVKDLTNDTNEDIGLDDYFDNDGSRSYVSILPLNNLWETGHTYRVTLESSIADLVGNILGSDYTFQFRAADWCDGVETVWLDDFTGIRQYQGTTGLELEVGAGSSDLIIVQDLTQTDKQWTLGYEDQWDQVYHSPPERDEKLETGYHNCLVWVTNNCSGLTRSVKSNFYIFNASPVLSSPANAASLNTTRPTLSFSSVGVHNADHYDVYVSDPVTDEVVFYTPIFETGQEDYSVTVPASRQLKPQTRYQWQVIAADNHYWELGYAESQTWEFTTGGSHEDSESEAVFQAETYLQLNPDVQLSWVNTGLGTAWDHYKRFGRREGRAAVFDASDYLAVNPDVAAAGYTEDTAIDHYVKWGRFEDRPTAFDAGAYLTAYKDVARNWPGTALEHYLRWGKGEGRNPCPAIQGE